MDTTELIQLIIARRCGCPTLPNGPAVCPTPNECACLVAAREVMMITASEVDAAYRHGISERNSMNY